MVGASKRSALSRAKKPGVRKNCFGRSTMTDAPDALEQLLQQSSQLYTLPGVAVRVLDLTNHPLQVDAAQLKACIEQDPALTTKVLRVVNSSLFGLSRRVSDLSQALGLLGAKPLKLL